mgnify:CR=1 FL=1
MGHYSDDYEHASADLVDYYGQPISYIDPSLGASVSIDNAAVASERSERRKNEYGWYVVQTRKVILLNADATVRLDGTVTISGVSYSIEGKSDCNGERTVLELIRASAGEVSRPGYRGGR